MSKIMRQVQREIKRHRKDFEDQRTLEVAVLAQVLGEAMVEDDTEELTWEDDDNDFILTRKSK